MLATPSYFSHRLLHELLQPPVPHITALVLATTNRISDQSLLASPDIPVAQPSRSGLEQTARLAGIPIYQIRSGHDKSWLAAIDGSTNLFLVACLPLLLHSSILEHAKQSFLNLHPSLLPAFRGPDPLFWQFRYAVNQTGMTLHRIDTEIDSGAILAQHAFYPAVGIDRQALTDKLVSTGIDMLKAWIARGCPEQELYGPFLPDSYQGWPAQKDLCISTSWSARRAYQFICGTSDGVTQFPVRHNGKIIHKIRRAIAFDPRNQNGSNTEQQKNTVSIHFSPGILYAC